MIPTYVPFTYLPESTARLLAALVGPVVVYQPLVTAIAEDLSSLASLGLIEIRTPLTGDEDRLEAALAEFGQWGRMNPGKSTQGTGYVGSRQGVIPFFDDHTINRIRSEIHRYGTPAPGADENETTFSARLFLAIAEENDRAADHLDRDLEHFKELEKGFLDSLVDGDEAGFNRQAPGSGIWREDPGARLTEQRLRAWAALASADDRVPELLITTSKAAVETLMEMRGDAIHLEQLAAIGLSMPPAGERPLLTQVLSDFAARPSLTPADLGPFAALGDDDGLAPAVTITLYGAMQCPPVETIGQMAPSSLASTQKKGLAEAVRNTLIVVVEY